VHAKCCLSQITTDFHVGHMLSHYQQRLRKVFESGEQSMASAEHEPITGVWGRSPQWGPGAEPLVRAPLKLRHFFAFGRLMQAANLPSFLKSRNTENQTFVLSRQRGHRTILFYFFTPASHIWSVEWNFVPQKQTPSFLTRYSYAVVSGIHNASVVRLFVCGSWLCCGWTMRDRAMVDIDH